MYNRILTISVCLFGMVYSESCSLFNLKKEYLNKKLVGHSVFETTTIDHHACARECISFSVCKSIDYYKRNNSCKLNDVDSSSVNPDEFSALGGTIFSDINDWPRVMAGSCSSRPCEPFQRCISTIQSYICQDITCPEKPLLDHGQIQLSEPGKNKFLDMATVVCDTGSVPSRTMTTCKATGKWGHITCTEASDCKEILDNIPNAMSGIYDINLWDTGKILSVYCDMETDGGGWTVFQRRFNGTVEFYRNFSEYENGFGSLNGEFWLGLRYIQEIALQGSTELRIDMSKANGEEAYELFQDFTLDKTTYILTVGLRTGNAGNAGYGLQYCNGNPFTTLDRDVDNDVKNCAVTKHGAWWYDTCSYVNLNGLYCTPGKECATSSSAGKVKAFSHYGFARWESLQTSKMMLRRK